MPPLLLGHRGARASRHIPENTLESFELCLHHGCDGFEFDVRLSADGQAVICHDASTAGMKIEKTEAKNLPLLTLDDVLKQFAKRAFLDIELKVAGLEELTRSQLRNCPPHKGYVVSSFLPGVLETIYHLDPSIPLGFLSETQHQFRGWRESPAEWVIPRFDLTDENSIKQIHGAGRKLMLWTVNRVEQMQEFASWNVDAIISDDTKLLVQSLLT